MSAIRQEPNPYYLLEWLIIPDDTPSEFWLSWEGERTAGAEKGSLTGVEAFFQKELPYELIFGAPIEQQSSFLLRTASRDLSLFYGEQRWKAGVDRLRNEVNRMLEMCVSASCCH